MPSQARAGLAVTPRYAHTATLLPDGDIVIIGGTQSDAPTIVTQVERAHEGSYTLTTLNSAAPYVARASHTATLLPTGEILVAGGMNNVGGVENNVQIYNPKADCWRPTVNFTQAGGFGRYNHTATLLRNGQVLICGGNGGAGATPAYAASNTCDLFTPTMPAPAGCGASGGAMSATGVTMQAPRADHTATLLNDGRVYIVGGLDNTGFATNPYLVTAEIYTPGSNSTLAAAGLITARAYHRATLLGNGKVLIVGGHNNKNLQANRGFLDSSEIYDAVADRTTPGGALLARLQEQVQTIMPDGTLTLEEGLGTIATTYFDASRALASSPASVLKGAFAPTNIISTMNITAGTQINVPLDLKLGSQVTGTILEGFILFSTPSVSYTGGIGYLTPGAEDPTTGALSGAWASLNNYTVGCSDAKDSSTCGKIRGPGSPVQFQINDPGGQYFATPSPAISGSDFTLVGGGASGSVNVSTVDWSPHGLSTGGTNSGTVTAGTILQGDVTIKGIPAAYIGANLSSARLKVSGGAFTVSSGGEAIYNVSITAGTGRFNTGFSGSPDITLDASTGFGQATGRISITGVTGSVIAATAIAQDPCNMPGTGACGAGQGQNVNGQVFTGLTGEFQFAADQVQLDNQANFRVDVATVVIRKMIFSDQETYTPTTNSWAFTLHSTNGGGSYGSTGTMEPSGTMRMFGGRSASGVLGDDSGVIPQFPGTAAGASPMTSPRANGTATVLPRGQILLAGGVNGPNVLPTAETFDPETKTFTRTGPMNVARDLHTATLLTNGRVLVAGGFATTSVSSGSTNTAEIYYPDTRSWVATSTMPVARDNHTATLLPNGNVLVAGGFSSGSYLPNAEIYITTKGVWQPLPNMPQARADHSATLLQDGRVLIAGGINASGILCTAYIYDPNYTGGGAPWYADTNIGGATCAGVQGHSATLLPSGRVLFAGGDDAFGETNNSFIYVPAAVPSPDNAAAPGSWINTVNNSNQLNVPRFNHSALMLPNGTVMLLGGAQALGNALKDIETFNVSMSSWQITLPMVKQRFGAMSVLGHDGVVYIFGGSNGVDIENTYESQYFTGSVDGFSLGVPQGTRKPQVISVSTGVFTGTASTGPVSGALFGTVPQTNGPGINIVGKDMLGFGEAAGGGAASGNSSHHNPRLIVQGLSGSGGAASQNGGAFTLDLTTGIYATGNQWPAVSTGIYLNLPSGIGTPASPPGLGGTIMPYGWYQLRAYSNAVFSDALPLQIGPPTPPLAPTGVQVLDIGRSSITWTWTKPAALNNNQLDGWDVFSSTTGVFVTTTAVTQLTYSQSNLAPNTTAQIMVAAYTSSGDGPLGNSTTYYTYCSSPVFNTANFSTFTAVSFNTLTLHWDPDGNSVGTYYEVYQSQDNFATDISTPVPLISRLTSTGTVISQLSQNTQYWFKVRAFNGNDLPSDYSVTVTTKTLAPVANVKGGTPGSPYNPATTIQWGWDSPGPVSYFNVYNATVPFGQPGYLIGTAASASQPVFYDVGLATNSSRVIMVSAVTAAGEGPLSLAATAYTQAAVPGLVTPPLTNITTGSFTASWTANGNPLNTTYQMVVLDSFNRVISTVTTTNFVGGFGNFASSSAASQFTVEVQAINGNGEGSGFLVMSTTYTLPDNPTGLQIIGTTPNSVSLQWSKANNSSSATFEVTFTTAVDFTNLGAIRTAVPFAASSTLTSVTIGSLLTSTTYQFRVQARSPAPIYSGFTVPTVTTSPFNGGVPTGSLGGLIVHTVPTLLAGTVAGGRTITLQVPANAFPQDTFVTISTFDASGGNSKCPGGVGIGLSITPNPYIQPLHPVFLTFGYTNAELGAVPTAQAALNRVDTSGTCVPLQTTADTANNTMTSQLNHFSLFQLANVAPAATPDDTVVFPNPFYPSQGNGFVTFKNMPASSRVRIFTVRGELVYEGTSNGSGIFTWGGINRFGRAAASGVYLAVVEHGGDKNILKVVVIR